MLNRFINQNGKNPTGTCTYCGAPISFADKICRRCKNENDSWVDKTEGICGNCHAPVGKDDKYCRICGTKVGEGEFLPFQNIMQCIYGPRPIERVHTCESCGYKWSTVKMIDKEEYCPKCGGKAPYVEDENSF